MFVFNDERLTTVDDMLTVNIYNPHPSVKEDAEGEQAQETEEVQEV